MGRIKTLKPEEDAYGQEIWAYYMSRDSYEIIERDDGYFDVTSGPKTYFSEYKDWLSHKMRAMEFVKGRVLCVWGLKFNPQNPNPK